jgi:hypothetical protein
MNRYGQIRRRREGIQYAQHIDGRVVRFGRQTGNNIPTPDHIARRIVGYFQATFGPLGFVLACCDGPGVFSKYFSGEEGKDWGWCEITRGRDFLDWTRPVSWIIDNPPWGRREFLALLGHAFEIGDNVAFLTPVGSGLGSRARMALAKRHGFGARIVIYLPRWGDSGSHTKGGYAVGVTHWQRGYHGKKQFVDWQ